MVISTSQEDFMLRSTTRTFPRTSFRTALFTTSLIATAVATTGCEPGGVGDPCIPEDEYRAHFSNFAASEVYVESRSFQCETRVCLVNHFQGRVSCPYGQTSEDLSLPPDAPERCRIPGTDGDQAGESIDVPVKAWRVERSPDESVYCSCRCDGPDEDAQYCECPSGYSCEELVPDLGASEATRTRRQLAGSYCIKAGTSYRPSQRETDCRTEPEAASCPEPAGENP
ncbi:MAG TPA: hypothetical protein VFU02_22705 [Polyangiaceae bacterium]|nr:hypothetical protein [Polyangiaceae bacterium]